ncbi:acetate--CoA ligase [candidate division KSB1 bacterium]|nr:acetate--CoA ligase [candidate division KSB1 bacterium]
MTPSHGDIIRTPYRSPVRAHIKSLEEYQRLYERSIREPEQFWADQAKSLYWYHPWTKVLEAEFHDGEVTWFQGGMLNVAFNCLDRHLPEKADDTAIIWEADEPSESRHITYRELKWEAARLGNVLKHAGVRKGDRVIIYLPMVPELAYAMLACARIGAVHSVVFAGFSANSLRDRIIDSQATVVITANEGMRGGKPIPLKEIVDDALDGSDIVKHVLVAKRTNKEVPMKFGRDVWLEEAMANERGTCPCEWMSAEDPLFILYTSGSTGKPKGVLHTQGGYLLFAALSHKIVFDYHPGDIYCCVADAGWITGHSYVIYGPLANGATSVMFESTPVYPDPGRYWSLVERHRVNSFYTAPTAIRALAREGEKWVKKYDRSSLRILGTVGEPINPEAWKWYFNVVGEGKCPVVDTWWQTETGGIMITPLPGVTDLKPGSATLPFFGVDPMLVDEHGKELHGNGVSGHLCIRRPWPGMARTIYGDHKRFRQTYFAHYKGHYFTGDGCRRDEDGYYWITGRVDDVINVAGHRLGTAEIESSLVANHLISEAAVVGVPHEIKGTAIFAFVVPRVEAEGMSQDEMLGALKEHVRNDISPIAMPEQVLVTPGLPKTRSGKIMRRILRKIAEGEYEELGNTSTLLDPSVVDFLIRAHKKLKK